MMHSMRLIWFFYNESQELPKWEKRDYNQNKQIHQAKPWDQQSLFAFFTEEFVCSAKLPELAWSMCLFNSYFKVWLFLCIYGF